MFSQETSTKHSWILDSLKKTIEHNNKELLWILDHLIVLHVGGSRLYGINKSESDWDIRGIVVAPKQYWVGNSVFQLFEGKDTEKNLDFVIYDFRKWLNLTLAVNPNVVETLFVERDSESMVLSTEEYRNIRADILDNQLAKLGVGINKSLLSQRAYVAFHGYSTAQLKKMVIKHGNKTGRHDIVDEYGFDVKFASHGFRLARQGAELLRTGKMTFPRPDKEDLIKIRRGEKYKSNELDKCVSDLELELKDLEKALDETILPKKTDNEIHNKILIDVFDNYVNKGV